MFQGHVKFDKEQHDKFQGRLTCENVRSFQSLRMYLELSISKHSTLVPKNLCAIILSTIYLSLKNLGRKFELIWVTENLGTNFDKNEQFSTKFQWLYICLSSLLFIVIPVILLSIVSMWVVVQVVSHYEIYYLPSNY